MNVTASFTKVSATSRASVSWYVRPTRVLATSPDLVDALTVAGPKGPGAIAKLRQSGFSTPVLFDGCGYADEAVPPAAAWVAEQSSAGADRLLLPGEYVPWDGDDHYLLVSTVKEQAILSEDLDAAILLALDSRWVARQHRALVDLLGEVDRPVALVLAHRADPLSVGGAVAGLRRVAQRVPHLSVLRSDHGALGAVAFGAIHASVGLTTSTRHFATNAMRPRRLRDTSPRVFVRPLLDWFRASEIAGWTATGDGRELACSFPCCNGAELARFLDEDLARDADRHNMYAVADFADQVLNAQREDRGHEFLNECRAAAIRYGHAGFKGPADPKAQLTGWALS